MFNGSDKKTAVALGSFDGLHKGHKAVIASALSMRASGLLPVVLLFDEHPQKILSVAPPEILQKSKRNRILENAGAGIYEISFSSVCSLSPEEFFDRILVDKLNAGAVCCGENYRFGAGGAGDCEVLKGLCSRKSVSHSIVDSVDEGGLPVSSTRIRSAVKSGDIRLANAMLGRPFSYEYVVVSGDARGRLMGAPTANQLFDAGFCVPAFGVYASVTQIDGCEYPCVTNIGIRPTFGGTELRSETHIIGFSGDLYGRNIEVSLLDIIRGEKRFSSMDELSTQIRNDIETSQSIYLSKGDKSYV